MRCRYVKFIILGCFFLCLLSWSGTHKFYLSVTQVNYSEKEHSLQMTSRLFIDDLNSLILERYSIDAHFETKDQHPLAMQYLEVYFQKKFKLIINGKALEYQILGQKRDTDVVVFFIEAKDVYLNDIYELEVYNALLTDLFDEQQNVVHLKINNQKKSFLLMKDKPSGLLKLD
jgi:hypothetical protein